MTSNTDTVTAALLPRPTLRTLLNHDSAPILIGVAGDSGSGKTTYTNGLRRMLGPDIVATIGTDGYHAEDREQRRKSGRIPLDPDLNNLELLQQHLQALKRGEQVEVPIYNHRTGTFDAPKLISAPAILVVEGLHALYPQFLPLLDFTVYVEPDREIKQRWKLERDLKYRGHGVEYLADEMRAREAGYKRWIEFQKTDANVVIKIHQSRLRELAEQQFYGAIPDNSFYIELIFRPMTAALPKLRLPFNLARMLGDQPNPFMIAVVPRFYWGQRVNAIQLDGAMTWRNVLALEEQIVEFTGIPLRRSDPDQRHENVSAIQFTQLLVTWPILEHITHLLEQRLDYAGV